MTYRVQNYVSPVGPLRLVALGSELCGVIYERLWPTFAPRFKDWTVDESQVLAETRRQLESYFAGRRRSFDLPVALVGTTFQRRAWTALLQIPFGATRSYREQAELIGAPAACRAVGRANGANPLSIVLPCHRVIGQGGALTGYGGGLAAKRRLLALEASI